MKYKYGMKHRPFGIGCQPRGVASVVDCNKAETSYYNIIVYNRELTDQEINSFELIKIKGE